MKNSDFVTRFAPSPTGPLHLGHAYSAMLAHDMARSRNGLFLLRLEDIDQGRARTEWETLIEMDLTWLGLDWPRPIMRQSDRLPQYRAALRLLWDRGLLFPCACSRRDIAEAMSAPQEGVPRSGPDGPIYPGTCRPASDAPHPPTAFHEDKTLRLNMVRAVEWLKNERGATHVSYEETGQDCEQIQVEIDLGLLPELVGDVVLSRRDMGTTYHTSVVVDDAAQGVTHVVRGADLAEATTIHVLLQALLDLPVPVYSHHRLIRDEHGKRLAKRDDARALRTYRESGFSPADIRNLVDLTPPA